MMQIRKSVGIIKWWILEPHEAKVIMSERSPNDGGDIILGHSISQLLFDRIEVVDIGLVVLAVVDLHYLSGDHLKVRIARIGWDRINEQSTGHNPKFQSRFTTIIMMINITGSRAL